MKMQVLSLVALLLVACAASTALAGNPDRQGTAGAQELTIPNSARGMALGNGAVADPGGVEMLFYNPAAIAGVRNIEAYFTNLSYIADMKKNYVAVGAKTGFGTIALSVDVLSIGDIIETTEESPDGTGRIISPNFSVIGLSFGRYMTDQVRFGVTAKLISESVLQADAKGFAFDGGIQYRPGPQGLSFGLAVKNFGTNMTFSGSDFESFHSTSDNPQANERSLATQSASFELPSYFELGAMYELSAGSAGALSGYGTFRSNNFSNDEVHLGAEYGWKETLFLRGGGTFSGDDDYLFGPSFGAGFAVGIGGESKLHADYTMRIVNDYFDDNHIFALKMDF